MVMIRVVERPDFYPYKCVICGVNYDRQWYVLLDIALEVFDPRFDGQIILCDECWKSTSISVSKAVQEFMRYTENNDQYVAPTFNNSNPLTVGLVEKLEEPIYGDTLQRTELGSITIVADAVAPSNGSDLKFDKHNPTTEPDNPDATASDIPTEPTENDGQESDLRNFRNFFGESGGGK